MTHILLPLSLPIEILVLYLNSILQMGAVSECFALKSTKTRRTSSRHSVTWAHCIL